MRMIDFIYRFDPERPNPSPLPGDAIQARHVLEEGHRLFARWTESCQTVTNEAPAAYVVPCTAQDIGVVTGAGQADKQAPFAVVLGCSDARVPAEMIFGQVRNNLFVVRLAGNVLSDEGVGSVIYAAHHLHESIRIIVVLGHTGCGAVSAAVDTYLSPWGYLEKISCSPLRAIVDRIFVPVRKAATALENLWGPEGTSLPHYREALIETAVFVNAAQAAYNLRTEMKALGRSDLQVVYGVFDLRTHRIWSIPVVADRPHDPDVYLVEAPASLAEFEELSIRMALRIARKTGRKPKQTLVGF